MRNSDDSTTTKHMLSESWPVFVADPSVTKTVIYETLRKACAVL